MWFFRCVNNALKKLLTLILGSVSEVHMAMSSLVLISGYLFLAKSASNSCSCCEVKCVLCLLWRLSLTLFLLLLALMSFVSSSWLSGLTGLWLGSSEAGSETWDSKLWPLYSVISFIGENPKNWAENRSLRKWQMTKVLDREKKSFAGLMILSL